MLKARIIIEGPGGCVNQIAGSIEHLLKQAGAKVSRTGTNLGMLI